MRENPSGKNLLEIAREVLKNELIPALPTEQRYSALMIANAMAIVMRQLEADGVDKENDVNLRHARELAGQIRCGAAADRKTWQALYDTARKRVAESNPKYL